MNPKPKPVVTFLVPCGDNEQYLLTCIQSILMQTFIDFEVLLLDEGLSPAVTELARQMPSADPRIQHQLLWDAAHPDSLREPDWTAVQGELIWPMSAAHCLASPHVLQDFVTQFILTPRLGVAFCRTQCLDENNVPYESYIPHKTDSELPYQPTLYPGRIFFRQLLKENLLPAPSVMVRNACYEQAGIAPWPMDEFHQWQAWLCFSLDWDVYFDPEPKVYNRQSQQAQLEIPPKSPAVLERMLQCYQAVETYIAEQRYPKPFRRQAQLARLQFMRRKGMKMSLTESLMRLYRHLTVPAFEMSQV